MLKMTGRALLFFTGLLGATAACAATNLSNFEDGTLLSQLQGIRFSGKAPALTGFSPSRAVDGLQKADRSYSTAYKSAAGCVAYFLPSTGGINNVQIKWSGKEKCNGRPLQGEGELLIRQDNIEGGKKQIVLRVLQGNFVDGLLQGKGKKTNFTYDESGKFVEDTYVLSGNFVNGVLDGDGEQAWTGPAAAIPSAWIKQGQFKNGDLVGGSSIIYAQLHPAAGVEAAVQKLKLSAKSEMLVHQAYVNDGKPVDGAMFLEGDAARWSTTIYSWDNLPTSAVLKRHDAGNKFKTVELHCTDFGFQLGRIVCNEGLAFDFTTPFIFGVMNASYNYVLPVDSVKTPLRVRDNTKVVVGTYNDANPMTCNQDLSLCKGDSQIMAVGFSGYWYGSAELRNGKYAFTKAKLFNQLEFDKKFDPQKDKLILTCKNFSGPTDCENGEYYIGEQRKIGHFKIEGVTTGLDAKGEFSFERSGKFKVVMEGWGSIFFNENEWADVWYENDKITRVRDCGDNSRNVKISCKMRNNVVVFVAEAEEQPDEERVIPVEPFQWPEIQAPRFTPTPIPQRPVYVLPGMK